MGFYRNVELRWLIDSPKSTRTYGLTLHLNIAHDIKKNEQLKKRLDELLLFS